MSLLLNRLLLAILIVLPTTVLAHMKDKPDLDQWLMSLHSKHRGGCCDKQEAETMADPDWRNVKDMKAGTCIPSDVNAGTGETTTHKEWLEVVFCVKLESPYDHTWTWWEVYDASIVDQPNKAGPALIWVFWAANRLPYIRCFLPGALG
jgi:hypothetical protein